MARFPLDPSGMWRELRRVPRAGPRRPALFLDRDGTLIEPIAYLSKPQQVALVPGALASLRAANRHGVLTVLVTNQSGIGRGYFGWPAFAAVQDRLHDLIEEAGGRLDAVYACPALPGSGAGCRKPEPGMLLAAAEELPIDLAASWIAGDSVHDLEAGKRAGLGAGWLVPGACADGAAALAGDGFRVTVGRDLAALATLLGAPPGG